MAKRPSQPLTPDQVLDKMAKYCAYQERCVKDVRDKLKTYEIPQEDRDRILDFLLDNRSSTMTGLPRVLSEAKSIKAAGV